MATALADERIIPALAGNTHCRPIGYRPHRDHPRSRGEYVRADSKGSNPYGSSPLSRGILTCKLNRHRTEGIIPALAGNTVSSLRARASSLDHPRSRGEYTC